MWLIVQGEVAPVSWTPERWNFRSSTMARKRAPYAPEFRRQMIELVRAGRTPEELAKEFEPSAQAIRNWVAQADRDEGRRADGLTTAEREELNRLRRENRQLKLEREILSKAAAWFARETDVIPPKGSRS
jgi:transposase